MLRNDGIATMFRGQGPCSRTHGQPEPPRPRLSADLLRGVRHAEYKLEWLVEKVLVAKAAGGLWRAEEVPEDEHPGRPGPGPGHAP